MTSNGTTYFLTSATTSAQQNSYMEDFNDTEQDWFLDEDQQVQSGGSPTADDFSALFNVPIDDSFFGVQQQASTCSQEASHSNPQAEFSQPAAVYQPYGSEAGPSANTYSRPTVHQFETLQPYDPCQPSAASQSQYSQQAQPYTTASSGLGLTPGTEFDLSAAVELTAAFENNQQQSNPLDLPPFERQSSSYVPECQPSTSSAGHFGGGESWLARMDMPSVAGTMQQPLNQQQQQQYVQRVEIAAGYRLVQDDQQIGYVECQDMMGEMSNHGQYVTAQTDGYGQTVQVMPAHANNSMPHMLQQNQAPFHSLQAQPLMSNSQGQLIGSSQPPTQPMGPSNGDMDQLQPSRKMAAARGGGPKKVTPVRQQPSTSSNSFASATLGSVMEKIFANTGDMNAAVRFTPEKSAEFGEILCQYNNLMAEQEATGLDLTMQIKAVEERIVALLSVAEPTSQTPIAPYPSSLQPTHVPPNTAKPPAKAKWRKKPSAKQDLIPNSTPSASKPLVQPAINQVAAIIQMDPSITSFSAQQLAQMLPAHLIAGANGQPVTVLLDYGSAGQQPIQLQTMPVTSPVGAFVDASAIRRVPIKKADKTVPTVNGIDLDNTIEQVVSHQKPFYVFNPPLNGTIPECSSAAPRMPPKRKSRAKVSAAQIKGPVPCMQSITPPPPPVILPSPAELGKRIEDKRIKRKENISKEFDILADSLAEEDCEKPFASKSDFIQRLLPFAFSYEPEISQGLLNQFDHELLRHSVSIMERRKVLESKMRSIFFREALGEDVHNHELSMLLHLDCEYERRILTKEREAVTLEPSNFVPDSYVLNGCKAEQQPSTSSLLQPLDKKPCSPLAMDFDYHDFDPQEYLDRLFNMDSTPSPVSPASSEASQPEEQPKEEPAIEEKYQSNRLEPAENGKDVHQGSTSISTTENGLEKMLQLNNPELPGKEIFCGIVKPELVEPSTSHNWSTALEHTFYPSNNNCEPHSLSHLPPKLRLTRARQIPQVDSVNASAVLDQKMLNEGEKVEELVKSVGDCEALKVVSGLDARNWNGLGMKTSDGDDLDENPRGLEMEGEQQVVLESFLREKERKKDLQECKLRPLKIKLNRNTLAKSPLQLTLDENTSSTKREAKPKEKESKEERKRRKKEEKREKKRLKHLQQAPERAKPMEPMAETGCTSSAPEVICHPATPSPIPAVQSPSKRRRPCWESAADGSSPSKICPRKKVTIPPLNGLKLRIAKVLLTNKAVEPIVQEEVSLQEPVANEIVGMENGKQHHHKSNGKRKKRREHRNRVEVGGEGEALVKQEEKSVLKMKIPKLKIKIMPKEAASSLSPSGSEGVSKPRRLHQQLQASSSACSEPSLNLKVQAVSRPKPPPFKAPPRAISKKGVGSESSRALVSPYNNSCTSAFKMEVNQLCEPLLNGNHSLFGLPAAQMRQNCGGQAPTSPTSGFSPAINARDRVQFSPCDDDPEDDRLRSETSQLLTKLM